VAKPFSADVLRAQIASILENRRRVQMAAIGERVEAKAEDNKPDPEDLFVIRFTQLVQERIDDETLNVEDIASQMAMSRTQLYRKLKALTNNSPNELIKEIRMREAKQLLAQGNLSVSEVAYRTGFTSPSYFTKCYTEYFGTLPSKKAKGEK
jgi:AraC-like DNA-binding protein